MLGDEVAALPAFRRPREPVHDILMTYALLQTSMTPPPVEALQRAFRSSDALSAADAVLVADDAFGILARDLPEDEAQNIAASLAAEDVAVELVAERDLPRLPDAEVFSSFQFGAEGLRFFDAREHATEIPYHLLRLVAVGFDKKEVRVELVFGDAVLRYHTTLAHLHFHHAPEVHGRTPGENLVQWVRLLVQRLPKLILNRGAANLANGGDIEHVEDFVGYPRLSAFHEEIVWLLWHARQDQADAAGSAA